MLFRLIFIWELCAHDKYWHDSLFPGIHKHVATAVSLLWGQHIWAVHSIWSPLWFLPHHFCHCMMQQIICLLHRSLRRTSTSSQGQLVSAVISQKNNFQQAASLQLPNEALRPISRVGCVELSSSSVPFWPHRFYWSLCLVMLFTLTVIHERLKLEDIKSAMLQLLWQCFTMFLLILKFWSYSKQMYL